MAIFAKDQTESKGETRVATSMSAESALSVIAYGMKVVGDIESNGVVKIEGTVEGSVRGGKQVLIGRQGMVKGNISSREIVVGGNVDGTITAEERVEIQATSSITGDVYSKTIVVIEGGRLNGTVHMDEARAMRPPEPKIVAGV